MDIKEIARRMFHSFFIILGGSLMAMYVFMLLFAQDDFVHMKDITALFVIAIVTDLAHFIFYSKKEPGRKQMLVRLIIQLIFVVTVILFIANFMEWIQFGEPVQVIVFIGLIITVYIIVVAIDSYKLRKLADKLNQKLKERYRE